MQEGNESEVGKKWKQTGRNVLCSGRRFLSKELFCLMSRESPECT